MITCVVPASSEITLVLVDFDDTLVDTAPRFLNARRELFRVLAEAGFPEPEVERVHHEVIDPSMRKRFGFGPSRMEPAFRATYEALCAAADREMDKAMAERVCLLGRGVAGTPPVLNGAIDALARLARSLPTALYTQAGDAAYQMGCIAECGILDIIPAERIRICEHKTTAAFRQALKEFAISDPATTWMIGNSMRSDINPALEAGANAIFVEMAEPWVFDMVAPVSNDFHRVGSFGEAVNLLLPPED
jgi:putative hydrolase of the HAD superfamily